jgi:signal transduction histidine kinase
MARGNVLDLGVDGHALSGVAARERAGGLSALKIGPLETLAGEHAAHQFWNLSAIKALSVALIVLAIAILTLDGWNRRSTHLRPYSWLALGWAALSVRIWQSDLRLDNSIVEFLAASAAAPLAAAAMLFLLRYAGRRWRPIERVLWPQVLLMPLTLLLAGPSRLFHASALWYLLLGLELLAVMGQYAWLTRRQARTDYVPMVAALALAAALLAFEFGLQHRAFPRPPVDVTQLVLSMLLVGIGVRLLHAFSKSLQAAEIGRRTLETRAIEIATEAERNFAQMAEARVEQVTAQERKRIAADLHDDLGAKLLTIVHTSDSERISTLARDALEEMRLSVRGLTGKPMQLADALADWRAETVARLGQANIEIDWRSPAEEVEQTLPARSFVQTTRILRESVSNIIKHSGATHCKVRCAMHGGEFGLVIQDNGRGIPMELDGKLDRGHGMTSMKHRAKQMQGQCLVESAPGYGTVIRLTLPL